MLTPTLLGYTTPHSPLTECSLTTPAQFPQVLHTLFLWPEFKPSPGFLGHHPRATYLSFLGHLQLAHDSLPSRIVVDNVYLTCCRHWQTVQTSPSAHKHCLGGSILALVRPDPRASSLLVISQTAKPLPSVWPSSGPGKPPFPHLYQQSTHLNFS